MAKGKAIINRFDGGMAEDLRTTATNQCASSVNFDISTNPHKLKPFSDPIAETHASGPITDYAITDVAVLNISGTTPTVYGMGRASSGSTNVAIFKKSSTSDITAQWSASLASSGTRSPGTLLSYYDTTAGADKLYFVNGGAFGVFTDPSTISTVGSLVGPYTTNTYPKPYRHPIDNTVYLGAANKVYKFDAVTYTSATLLHTFGTNFEVQSFTEWGNYLAIGGRYFGRDKKSSVYLSNRVLPNDGAQQVIDWGEGSLVAIENIGGSIVGISYTEDVGGYSTISNYKLYIKVWSGGEVQTVKEIETRRSDEIKIWKAKHDDKLYFGYDTDRSLYVVGKNKLGEWFVTGDRYYNPTGSYITGTFNGISFVGDVAFIAYQDGGTTGYLVRQGTGSTYSLTSYYNTTINPNMEVAHRTLRKTLKSVRIAYTAEAANGTVGVGFRQDTQTSAFTSIVSSTEATAGEYVIHADMTEAGESFDEGYEFQFQFTSTGNVSIKQFEYVYELTND